jgi:HSP20 family protein
MKETTVPAKQETKTPDTRDERKTLTPPVDIFEVDEGLAVVVDLPGARKEDVDVRVEEDTLTIQAKTPVKESPYDLRYTEFGLANYFRQFILSDKVDRDKIEAQMRHGVLTVRLPRAEAAKPRQIQVNIA